MAALPVMTSVEKLGVPFSTRNAPTVPSLSRAQTTTTSATVPLPIHFFSLRKVSVSSSVTASDLLTPPPPPYCALHPPTHASRSFQRCSWATRRGTARALVPYRRQDSPCSRRPVPPRSPHCPAASRRTPSPPRRGTRRGHQSQRPPLPPGADRASPQPRGDRRCNPIR